MTPGTMSKVINDQQVAPYEKLRLLNIAANNVELDKLGLTKIKLVNMNNRKPKKKATMRNVEDGDVAYIPEQEEEVDCDSEHDEANCVCDEDLLSKDLSSYKFKQLQTTKKRGNSMHPKLWLSILNNNQRNLTKIAGNTRRSRRTLEKESGCVTNQAQVKDSIPSIAKLHCGTDPTQVESGVQQASIDNGVHQSCSSKELQAVPTNETVNITGLIKKKTRGVTRCLSLIGISEEERKHVTLNHLGQPIGEKNAKQLSSYLGTLARNARLAPFTYLEWTDVPIENKADMWKMVNEKFIIDERGHSWVLSTIGTLWRNFKSRMKRENFDTKNNLAARLNNRPKRIPTKQWETVVRFWSFPEGKARSEKGKASRDAQKNMHRMGSKSFARVREEMKKSTGRDPTEVEMFFKTRTGKDGRMVVDDKSKSDVDLLRSESEEIQNNALKRLIKPRSGRVPLHGKGVNLTQLRTNSDLQTQNNNKIVEMQAEMRAEIQAELRAEFQAELRAGMINGWQMMISQIQDGKQLKDINVSDIFGAGLFTDATGALEKSIIEGDRSSTTTNSPHNSVEEDLEDANVFDDNEAEA